MKSRLKSIKDCANCSYSITYGSPDCLDVICNCDDVLAKNLFDRDGRYCAGSCNMYNAIEKSPDGRIEQSKALQFILAGKSEFILHSTKTNEDFKFQIVKKDSTNSKYKYVYFLNVISGHEKIYAGHLFFNEDTRMFEFNQGKKGKVAANELNIRSLLFVLNKLIRCEHVGNLEVFHVGKCGKCGKKLTTPESILTGLGPTCSENLGIPRIKL